MENTNGKKVVVLSDQQMPEITGEHLLHVLQRHIPIHRALITASHDSVISNTFPVFYKGTDEFWHNILTYLADVNSKG